MACFLLGQHWAPHSCHIRWCNTCTVRMMVNGSLSSTEKVGFSQCFPLIHLLAGIAGCQGRRGRRVADLRGLPKPGGSASARVRTRGQPTCRSAVGGSGQLLWDFILHQESPSLRRVDTCHRPIGSSWMLSGSNANELPQERRYRQANFHSRYTPTLRWKIWKWNMALGNTRSCCFPQTDGVNTPFQM